MAKNFRGSTQKELVNREKSLFAKYAELFPGTKNFFGFLKFELVNLFFSWVPGALGFFLRKIFYPCLFQGVGKGVVFGRNLTLRHPQKICIGENSFIDDDVVLDAKGETNEGIRIGKNVYLGRNTSLSCKEGSIFLDDFCNLSANCILISETEVRLGKYCFLAGQCYLVAGGNHEYRDLQTPIMFQPSFSKGGIRIDEDVWLGAGVIILDGVSVGKGTVIGAGSVVTRSLPEYAIAAGVPARLMKDRRNM